LEEAAAFVGVVAVRWRMMRESVSSPGGATDLGNKNAFPVREFAFIATKPEVVGLGN
jgi:hypothetical protein